MIYDALKLIGLVTRELDGFRAFLNQCGGDELYFYVEGGDDSDVAKRLDAMMEEEDFPRYRFEPTGDYTECHYRVSCGDKTLLSARPEPFRNTDSLVVTKSEIDDLLTQVFDVPDWDMHFYNLFGVLDPYDGDLETIKDFFLTNEGPFTIEFVAAPPQ